MIISTLFLTEIMFIVILAMLMAAISLVTFYSIQWASDKLAMVLINFLGYGERAA